MLTASFFPYFIITLLVVVHEFGHLLLAKLFGGKILKVYIYPFGGISKVAISYNISLFREFLILIAGPFFQFLAMFILFYFFPNKEKMVLLYHYGILFFNLLPIYPLDGGKILCLFFHRFLPYKRAYYFTFLLSYLCLLFILYFYFVSSSFNLLFIFAFLTYKLIKEINQLEFTFHRFLMERYLRCFHFHKSKIVHSYNQFQRSYHHLIISDGCYYTEKEYLEKNFKKC